MSINVTVTAGVGGSITPDGVVSVPYGETQVFSVTPDSGYVIQSVNAFGLIEYGPFTDTKYYSVAPNDNSQDTEISATFALGGGGGGGGSFTAILSPNPATAVNTGVATSIQVSGNIGDGDTFKNHLYLDGNYIYDGLTNQGTWWENQASITWWSSNPGGMPSPISVGSHTAYVVVEDTTLGISATSNTITIIVTAGGGGGGGGGGSFTVSFNNKTGHGSASPNFGSYTVNSGDDWGSIVTADSGYTIDHVNINGVSNTPNSTAWNISLQITQNTVIDVYFTAVNGGGGGGGISETDWILLGGAIVAAVAVGWYVLKR